jgi:hypothetical protein
VVRVALPSLKKRPIRSRKPTKGMCSWRPESVSKRHADSGGVHVAATLGLHPFVDAIAWNVRAMKFAACCSPFKPETAGLLAVVE